METIELTAKHQQVIEVLKDEHLTSFQILNRVKNVSLILVVYNIIDELKSLGVLETYTKEGKKYHCLA